MFDLRYVKKLVDMLDGSTVDSIEISSDKGMKIRISKAQQQAPVMHAPAIASAPMAVAAATGAAEAAPAAKPEPTESLLEAKSPMVGTFFAAAEPGGKAYLAVGDRVRKGQIICIIEAMKIMNEIESEFDGTLREIVAQDAHPVEYGQVLFRIAPNG